MEIERPSIIHAKIENGYEIEGIDGFRTLQKKTGFIVITDTTGTGNHLHRTSCWCVKESNFYKKVISNRKKSGRYFWYYDVSKAKIEYTDALPCRYCEPLVP